MNAKRNQKRVGFLPVGSNYDNRVLKPIYSAKILAIIPLFIIFLLAIFMVKVENI
jgi:hypothetical protein